MRTDPPPRAGFGLGRLPLVLAFTLLSESGAACDQGARAQIPAQATTTVVSLRGIDCESCGARVIAVLKQRPGVYDASFDRNLAEITVAHETAQIGADDLLAVVREAGYEGRLGPGQGAYVPAAEFGAEWDVRNISRGEAVDLRNHLAPDKVTVFDFYAVWCKPCRVVDEHMRQVLATHDDVALRKLDVVDWDSEIARHHLAGVPDLPYIEVYARDGRRVARISGLKLDQLDRAIEKGRQ